MGQLTYFLPKEQTVTLRLGGSYAPKAKGELSLPYALMRQEHIEHQLYTFASLSSAYYELSIAPRYSFAVQRGALPWGLEVGCQYRYRGYMPQDRLPVHQHEWRATVQLIF